MLTLPAPILPRLVVHQSHDMVSPAQRQSPFLILVDRKPQTGMVRVASTWPNQANLARHFSYTIPTGTCPGGTFPGKPEHDGQPLQTAAT